jgi:Uma2 family endonuclease
MSVQLQRWTFTVHEYHRLAEVGILTEDDRVELIDGDIIKMTPIGSHHVACVNRLAATLIPRVGSVAIVSVQNPIHIDEYSEPEPDMAILMPRHDFYAESLAGAKDVLLIIEVADSFLDYDRTIKLSTYSRAGIPEVWIANLPADEIEAYSQLANGAYQKVRRAKRGDNLTPEKLPSLIIGVDEILD